MQQASSIFIYISDPDPCMTSKTGGVSHTTGSGMDQNRFAFLKIGEFV